jgi:serine protease AprX
LNGQQPSAVFNGQRVPIDDASNIPAGFEGYVQLALDLNLLNASFSVTQGPFDLQPVVHATFQPTRNVTRAEYAVAATRWLSASNQQ